MVLALFTLVLRKMHGWPTIDSLYFAATNRLAVGVGFVQPLDRLSRAILLALGLFHVALFGGLASAVVGETYKSFDAPADENAPMKRRLRLGVFAVVLWLCGAVGLRWLEAAPWGVSMYWSLALLTAANVGGLAPITLGGKLLTAWLSLLGCLAFGRAIGEVATLPLDAARRKAQTQVLDSWGEELTPAALKKLSRGELVKDLGIAMRRDSCDRNGFALLALVEMGKITAEDLAECREVFSRLDRSGRGRLSWDDLALVARDAKREGDEWAEAEDLEEDEGGESDRPDGGKRSAGEGAVALGRRLALAIVQAAGDVAKQVEQAGDLAGDLAGKGTTDALSSACTEISKVRASEGKGRRQNDSASDIAVRHARGDGTGL